MELLKCRIYVREDNELITQSLYERYLKLSQDPTSGIAPPGYSTDKISFVLELSKDGQPLRILDIRDTTGKRPVPLPMNVPEHGARSSGVKPYFLSDKAEYVLGLIDKSGIRTLSLKKFDASRELHRALLQNCETPDGKAVLRFLNAGIPKSLKEMNPFRSCSTMYYPVQIIISYSNYRKLKQCTSVRRGHAYMG